MGKALPITIFVVLSILAFLFGPMAPLGSAIWPESEGMDFEPTGVQIALITIYTIFPALAFGLGIVFLFFGYNISRKAGKKYAPVLHASLFWILWSWWLHEALHITVGHNFSALIAIEYAFHATSIVAVVLIIWILKKNFTAQKA
jgi:hypothetical protein